MAMVTAGFMWPPPKSPSVQAIVQTIKPIPRPILEETILLVIPFFENIVMKDGKDSHD